MIGERIKKRRLDLGLSQQQLAGREVTRAYISQVESGNRFPSTQLLNILADRLQTTADYLRFGNERSQDVLNFIQQSRALCRENAIEEALRVSRHAFELAKGSLSDAIRLNATINAGVIHYKAGKLYESKSYLELAATFTGITDDLDAFISTFHHLGNCAYNLGDYIHAADCYRRCLDRAKGHKKEQTRYLACLVFYASSLFRVGKAQEALCAYQEAFELGKTINEVRTALDAALGLGWALHSLGKTREALEVTKRALEISNTANEFNKFQLMHNSAIYAGSLGQHKEAISVWKRCLDHYKKNDDRLNQIRVLEELANSSLMNGDVMTAESWVDRALPLLPNVQNDLASGRIYRTLGRILKAKGFSSDALRYYQLATGYFSKVRAFKEVNDTEQEVHYIKGS